MSTRSHILCLALVLVGCSREPSRPGAVVDDAGRVVALPDTVRRVVSLAPNITEMVYAAGGGSRLVAVTTADDYPPEVNALVRLSALPVNFEAIVALEADLVLLNAEVNRVDDADRLVQLGVPAAVLSTTTTADVADDIARIGVLLGTTAVANEKSRQLTAVIDSLQRLTADVARPSVIFLIGFNTLYAFGRDSYIHDVIAAAGGRSVTADLDNNPVLNEEYVLARDPDYIIVAADATFQASNLTDAHPAFANLSAVRNGRVNGVHADVVLRAGPRLVNGAWRIARIIHPELFEPE